MKHINQYEKFNEGETYDEIAPLTIEEFSNIREAMYAVKSSDSPSAFQAKEFFQDQENFDVVIEKLRNLLVHGSEKKI